MYKIYKYIITHTGEKNIAAPIGSVPIFFALQNGEPHIWFRLKSGHQGCTESMRLYIAATGEVFSDEYNIHIGSIVTPEGYVWHCFYDGEQ